jgi:hypothetical protein
MATQTAEGEGPVVFFTGDGQQVTYPLSAITFENGEPTATPTPQPGDVATLAAWLKVLVKQGRLAPAPAQPAGEAMKVTAVETGTVGNRITVSVTAAAAAPSDPTKVDVTVTSIDVYAGLTLGALLTTLGSSTGTATQPGLVQFKPPLPPGGPDPVECPAAGPTTASPASWDLPSPTPAFTVEPRRTGTDATKLTVGVSNVAGPAGDKTFTLTATWQVKVPGVTALTVGTTLKTAVAFAVVIDPPPTGGGLFKLPRLGTVTLGGGAEAALAKPATATILAS